ncbi:hypothetical protein MAR_027905 [Mya arenaria]|uniref:Pectate lyase n=1 Tax=Mya arenaria TaxID=6604 RepID=A0ABY7DFU1_MYAAR|nr:hypothetical protein MAR_027905 [Mya arenaria]
MDGETKTCVEVVGHRGALKGVGLCQKKGGTCMDFQKGGRTVTPLQFWTVKCISGDDPNDKEAFHRGRMVAGLADGRLNTISNGFFSNAHVGGCLSVSNVNVSWS